MTVLDRPGQSWRRPDVLIGLVVGVIALGVTFTNPQKGGLLLVVGAAGLIVGLVALRSPVVAVLLLLGCSYGRELVKSVPGDALLLAVYTLAVSTFFAVRSGRYSYRRFHLGLPELLMVLYVLWNIGSMILPHELPGSDVWRFIVKGTILPLALYLAGRFAFDTERSMRALLWVVAGFTVYSTINAVAQIHGPSWLVYPKITITESGWKERAVGVFNQPVVNGILLAIGFAVLIYLAQDPKMRNWTRLLCYVAAAGAVYAVQLTQTRSALLGLVLIIVAGALFAKHWRTPFVVCIVGGLGFLALNYKSFFSSDRSAGGVGSAYELIDRLNIAATGLRAISEHPFVGIGLTRYPIYNTYRHVSWSPELPWGNGYGEPAHENEIGIAAETGLIGVVIWIAVLVAIVIALVVAYHRLPADQFFGRKFAFLGVSAAMVWVSNGTTVDMRLLDFANALPFLLMGVSVGLYERYRQTGRTLEDEVPAAPVIGGSPGLPGPRAPASGPQRVPEPAR